MKPRKGDPKHTKPNTLHPLAVPKNYNCKSSEQNL